jgi:hypothetical protein
MFFKGGLPPICYWLYNWAQFEFLIIQVDVVVESYRATNVTANVYEISNKIPHYIYQCWSLLVLVLIGLEPPSRERVYTYTQ